MQNFPLPLANAKNYPKPNVLATPNKHIFSLSDRNRREGSQFIPQGQFVKNGRAAIATVALLLGLKAGDTILLPEYFCPAMVEPFIWLGLQVRFYQLNENLNVNHEHFESLLDVSVKACLFVRFFGFTRDIQQSLAMAKMHNLLVIEDCAHSFFSKKLKVNEQSFDASICSLNKFFPCIDGGMFRVNQIGLNPNTMKQKKRDLKAEISNILSSIGLGNSLTKIKFLIKPKEKRVTTKDLKNDSNIKNKFRYFSVEDINNYCFWVTEFIIKTSNFSYIKAARIRNYQILYEGLKESYNGQPLFDLEDNSVPYVFPFLLNDSKYFHYIRRQGIQVLRWEEFYPTDNSIIEIYREKLIQIPCHQNLSTSQINKIISIINIEKN